MTAIWLPIDVVFTTFWLAVVSVQVPVPLPFGLFRNNRIDGDLSMRFNVCNRIGPSFVPFLFNRCCKMIEPSGMVAVWPVDATDVNVVVAFDVVTFFKADDVVCNWSVLPLIPFPLNEFVSMIWLVVMLAFFNADCSTNLPVSVVVVCFDVANVLANDVVVFLCNKIDGDVVDVLHVVLSSSATLLLMLTAPLFNKLNNSWPFCKIIWPFSVRAPRINIILLAGCCCCWC